MGSFPGTTRGRDEHRQWAHFPEPLGGETSTGNGLISRNHSGERRAPDNAALSGYVVERVALASDKLWSLARRTDSVRGAEGAGADQAVAW